MVKMLVLGGVVALGGCRRDSESGASTGSGSAKPVDPLSNIAITSRPKAIGWKLRIENRFPATISLLWDESAFVDASGKSLGRMIPSRVRRMDSAKAVAATPIPSGAYVDEDALTENMIEWLDARATRSGHGFMSLTFSTPDGKLTWKQDMDYGPNDAPGSPFFCFPIVERAANTSRCERSRAECEAEARVAVTRDASMTIGACEAAQAAWCFVARNHEFCVAGSEECATVARAFASESPPPTCRETHAADVGLGLFCVDGTGPFGGMCHMTLAECQRFTSELRSYRLTCFHAVHGFCHDTTGKGTSETDCAVTLAKCNESLRRLKGDGYKLTDCVETK